MKQLIIFLIISCSSTMMLNAQSIGEGDKHLYYERYKSAEQTFHNMLRSDPGIARAWLGLTRAYLLQDNYSKAFDSITVAPESIKSDPFYGVAYGSILLQQNKVDDAAKYFNYALEETKSKNVEVLSAIAEAHILSKKGDPNYAIELLNKALKRDKHNPALFVQLGDAYRKLLDGSEAFKAYQKALDENDKYALAYHRMGKIFLTQNNPEQYIKYFKSAIDADSNYGPSINMLYTYEFNRDPIKSLEYYRRYIDNADYRLQMEYDLADLYYVSKQYSMAIDKANHIRSIEGDSAQSRIYRLISYSNAENKDTAQAIKAMHQYFTRVADSTIVSKDYLVMVDYYLTDPGQDSMAEIFLQKALPLIKDSATMFAYYKKMVDATKQSEDDKAHENWLQKYYTGNAQATNLDLFNWALANYLSKDYLKADSVFGLYTIKYPEQSFGYYWQAKSKANQDSALSKGLAVPVYEKLIEILLMDSTDANFKKWIVESYEHLAAYEANIQKNYASSLLYFKKILEVDPANEDAQKYVRILGKDVAEN